MRKAVQLPPPTDARYEKLFDTAWTAFSKWAEGKGSSHEALAAYHAQKRELGRLMDLEFGVDEPEVIDTEGVSK